MNKKSKPVLIEIDEKDTPQYTPETAPPLPESVETRTAMQGAIANAGRRSSRLGRWFWGVSGAIVSFALSIAAWDFATRLLQRNPVLGWIAIGLIGFFVTIVLLIALRELAGFSRLRRLDGLHKEAEAAIATGDLTAARRVSKHLLRLYSARDDLRWALERIQERQSEIFDADGLIALMQSELMVPLDKAASYEIEAAARQVATVTAIVPLALADVVAAMTVNLRMIRRIAEIYGGRSGMLGSWRLLRTVFTHLVATGAVSVGDDLIHTVAGGGVLSKISRRFGEGVINGALTARVGVAAIEVCRPLPFGTGGKPSVAGIVKRALGGLFGRSGKQDSPPES